MFVRKLIVLVACLVASATMPVTAAAQSLGRPAEFYFDADANTVRPIVVVQETGDAAAQKLLQKIERNPHAKAELAQLAHLAMEAGRTQLGRDLYARALARMSRTEAIWRAAMWGYGWDLYRAGDAAGALEQWLTLQKSRASTASWIPPTNALVLWTLGRKEEAVEWYAAAVRTEPQQWRTPEAYATLLPQWRDEERAMLAQVQAAWAANPPTWP